ncbi:MFS transporter [Nocardioides dongxiaopingii]|uniref:MFS transporter n=1 Tax=Nocardioides dongxiaopingii TaxID=2576036 RepID=UPI001FE61F57|nr:MFS transporter [Nocardioides dongxiaopingii]
MSSTVSAPASLLRARTAVGLAFGLNGALFSTFVSRVPDLRSGLDLGNGGLGVLLLMIAVGSLVALPTSGALVARFGAAAVVRSAAVLSVSGMALAAVAADVAGSVPVAAVGLVAQGAGIGAWDVAMNLEGAEVERRLGRTIMPRFHAGFSLGTVLGALLGVAVVALGVSMAPHLVVLGVAVLGAVLLATRTFLPVEPEPAPSGSAAAWREPRTLAVGVMVLAFAVAEGSANDWLTLALVDGYDVEHWVGVGGFALFVSAMTLGRLLGPVVLDRWGRAPCLWATAALSAVGLLLVVHGQVWPVVVVGIVAWGMGASLGFPVGMSAAADEPARAAARVSVVSTIGYAAFLGGPPLLGSLGDRVGTLSALQVVAVLMVPAAVAVLATRPVRTS